MIPPTDAIKTCLHHYGRNISGQPVETRRLFKAVTQLSMLVAYAEQGWKLIELAKELVEVVREIVDGNTNENWDDCGLINAIDAFDLAISEEGK